MVRWGRERVDRQWPMFPIGLALHCTALASAPKILLGPPPRNPRKMSEYQAEGGINRQIPYQLNRDLLFNSAPIFTKQVGGLVRVWTPSNLISRDFLFKDDDIASAPLALPPGDSLAHHIHIVIEKYFLTRTPPSTGNPIWEHKVRDVY